MVAHATLVSDAKFGMAQGSKWFDASQPSLYTWLVMSNDELIQPSRKEFLALAKKHTLVPVYRTLTADLETPVSAFLRAAWESPECFLLESVENGEQVGRYTFIGLNPYKRIVSRGRRITISETGKTGGTKTVEIEGDVFGILRDALSGHTPARLPGLPPFTAGAVGFLSYDVVRQIEKLPATAKDELQVPDACLLFFDEVLAFDHVRKEIHLVVTADVTLQSASAAHADSVKRLVKLEKRLARPLPKLPRAKASGKAKLKVTHRTRKKDYLAAVETIREYIRGWGHFPSGVVTAAGLLSRMWIRLQCTGRCAL